jgi:hypothetical protein
VSRIRREVTAPLARWGSLAVIALALIAGHLAIAAGAAPAAAICWTTRPARARHRRTR